MKIQSGMRVRVIADEGTTGMFIKPDILNRREIGKTGTVVSYVPGHGGDVWFVE